MTWMFACRSRSSRTAAADIGTEQCGVGPLEGRRLARGHVFREAVEQLRDAPVRVRPVRGENVVGPAPEQQCVHPRHPGVDLLADDLVEERRLPAAKRETAVGVLVRPAGRLRDAVERGEQVDMDESHAVLLLCRPSSPGDGITSRLAHVPAAKQWGLAARAHCASADPSADPAQQIVTRL